MANQNWETSTRAAADKIIEEFLGRAEAEFKRLDNNCISSKYSERTAKIAAGRRIRLRKFVAGRHNSLNSLADKQTESASSKTDPQDNQSTANQNGNEQSEIPNEIDEILDDAIGAVRQAYKEAERALLRLPKPDGTSERHDFWSASISLKYRLLLVFFASFAALWMMDFLTQAAKLQEEIAIACTAAINVETGEQAKKSGRLSLLENNICNEVERKKSICEKAEKKADIKEDSIRDKAMAEAAVNSSSSCKVAGNEICTKGDTNIDKALVDCQQNASKECNALRGKAAVEHAKAKSAHEAAVKAETNCNDYLPKKIKCEDYKFGRQSSEKTALANSVQGVVHKIEDQCRNDLVWYANGLTNDNSAQSLAWKTIRLVLSTLFAASLVGFVLSFWRINSDTLADKLLESLKDSFHSTGSKGGGTPSALSSLLSPQGFVAAAAAATVGVAGVNSIQQTSVKEIIDRDQRSAIEKTLKEIVDRDHLTTIEKSFKETVLPPSEEQKVLIDKLGAAAEALKVATGKLDGGQGKTEAGKVDVNLHLPEGYKAPEDYGRKIEEINNNLKRLDEQLKREKRIFDTIEEKSQKITELENDQGKHGTYLENHRTILENLCKGTKNLGNTIKLAIEKINASKVNWPPGKDPELSLKELEATCEISKSTQK